MESWQDIIERKRKERTVAEWKALPRKNCGCGQSFAVEWKTQTLCRDCLAVRASSAAWNNPYLTVR